MKKTSKRGKQWISFAKKVLDHIESYTVPQYGDYPNDQVEGWGVDQCMDSIQRYVNRSSTNSRQGEEMRDLLKIAHYSCVAYSKIENKKTISPYKLWDYCERIQCIHLADKTKCRNDCMVYDYHKYLEKNKHMK